MAWWVKPLLCEPDNLTPEPHRKMERDSTLYNVTLTPTDTPPSSYMHTLAHTIMIN